MRVMIGDLEVLFPYPYIYPEQFKYMFSLQSSLGKGHIVLEMPTGTGKTVALLSLILAYQYHNPDVGKLIYCTRTVPEMDQVIEELHRVMAYRLEELNKDVKAQEDDTKRKEVFGICLSSRRNLCIHEEVAQYDNRNKVDAMCRNMTAQFVRQEYYDKVEAQEEKTRGGGGVIAIEEDEDGDALMAQPPVHNLNENQNQNQEAQAVTQSEVEEGMENLCRYYEGYKRNADVAALTGIYGIEEMRELGKERGWCPYFAARHFITQANVVVYNYQYMLDPKIANLVSKEIEANSIVVFDEAHNIDSICIEALSVTLDKRIVQASVHNVRDLTEEVKKLQEVDMKRLNDEYNQLVAGLQNTGELDADEGGLLAGSPLLPPDILQEAVPGNIRRATHFLMFLRTIIEFFKTCLDRKETSVETCELFVQTLKQQTNMTETRALKFAYDRLNSLLRTLQVANVDKYSPLLTLCNFSTLVSTYDAGFSIITEPYDERTPTIADAKIQLCCLDASLAIKPVFDRFSSVVITSGTLSPLNFYPKILNFRPTVCESFEMSISRNCICPIVVTKGSDQVPISSKYDSRLQDPVVNNYGRLLIELSKNVPDGLICFFTSYIYMEEVVSRWQDKGILQSILQHKLIFVETKDVVETSLALDSYKKACDRGRGAIFLSVSRGKIAEGIDFDRHYGRCVVLMGVPFQYTLGRVLRARLHYLSEKFEIGEGEFLTFDAIRQASQCLGRVIRSKTDYGLMIFADHRYSRADKRKKLPVWITQFLNVENWSMSTEGAIRVARTFLREMAQPHNMLDSLGSTMLTLKQATALNNKMLNATAVTGEVVEQKMAMQARVERELAEDEIDMTLKMDM